MIFKELIPDLGLPEPEVVLELGVVPSDLVQLELQLILRDLVYHQQVGVPLQTQRSQATAHCLLMWMEEAQMSAVFVESICSDLGQL